MRNSPYNKKALAFSHPVSRREFLRTIGLMTAGSLFAGCGAQTPAPRIDPRTPVPFTGPRPQVALAQASSYDRALVRQQVETLFDGLGGVKDIVGRGDKIAIKVNLTGGVQQKKPIRGQPPIEYHLTHPEVVRAVGELLLDAGAKELFLVEALWGPESFSAFGYTEVARELGAKLIDLNQTAPYSDFATVPVGQSWFTYESFTLNRILEEADAFVSIAKLKCHCTTGITLSMKNLVGIAPIDSYMIYPDDGYRTAFHGTEEDINTRLPRVIVDLNQARPIHLAVLDGILTIEGGEGPWNVYTKQLKPGVLLAGKNALSTDAIGTSVMGFDPTTEPPDEPFLFSDNHLNLAAQVGLGTNQLDMIDTVGVNPADVRLKFAACQA
jgi:uncharacterized protein (DUF362 family)